MNFFTFFLLIGAASAINIECDFYQSSWDVIGTAYSCSVTSMNLLGSENQILSFNGSHLSGKSTLDVKAIDFHCFFGYGLKFIPRALRILFPNLIAFNFVSCPIDSLTGDELIEYPSTQWFGISSSNLTRIPPAFFIPTPFMKVVSFKYNKIQHIGASLLIHLRFLEMALFANNPCINQSATSIFQMAAFFEALLTSCPDIEETSTITTEITTLSASAAESLISESTSTTSESTSTTSESTSTTSESTPTTSDPTSTTSTTTTTIQPSRCGIENLEDFVCGLDEEIQNLKLKVENLEESNENLIASNEELKREVVGLKEVDQELRDSNLYLQQQVADLTPVLETQAANIGAQGEQIVTMQSQIVGLTTENQEFRGMFEDIREAIHVCKCYDL